MSEVSVTTYVKFYFLNFLENNRLYDGAEAETRKSQASFKII